MRGMILEGHKKKAIHAFLPIISVDHYIIILNVLSCEWLFFIFVFFSSLREILNGIAVTDENGNKLGHSKVTLSFVFIFYGSVLVL